MQCRTAAANQGQSLGRAGHQHRLAAGGVQRGPPGAVGLGVMLGVDAGRQPDLMLVRRQDGGTVIGREIGPLRIGNHQRAARCGGSQRGGQHRLAQHALGIVRQHHDVCPVKRRREPRQHRRCGARRQRLGGFFVEPQELVRSCHEAGLGRGRPPGGDDKLAVDALGRLHQAGHFAARRIVPHHADQHGLPAEGRDIQRDIGRPAQPAAVAAGSQHRDRRLGRQPVGMAGDVTVQDDVAQHGHACIREMAHVVGQVDVVCGMARTGRQVDLHTEHPSAAFYHTRAASVCRHK